MPVDEHVEVDRIEVVTRGVCQPDDIAWLDSHARPLDITSPRSFVPRVSASPRDIPKPAQALARKGAEHRVAYAQESAPRDVILRGDALLHFGVRHGGEVDHCMRGEQIEVRHGFVRSSDHMIDLIGLGRE
jgi:hypothetical protein